jgi:GGDEF domain-containing protein
MAENLERRRVLLTAGEQERGPLRGRFEAGQVPGWEVVEADSLERARFVLQMDPCDVLLLDASLYRPGGLAWLALQGVPVPFLADVDPPLVRDALEHGACQWLPRELALGHPEVLAAGLHRAARVGALQDRAAAAAQALEGCRRQVSRLVGLLWEAAPGEGRPRWFSQRQMLERLEEELARAQRHGGPLTVVLGEVRGRAGEPLPAGAARRLATWTAHQVGQGKRRCDVSGQYGPHGFMLLLPRVTAGQAVGCCRRLRSLLEEAPGSGSGPFPALHACFGIASYSSVLTTCEGLLSRAEEELEQAREGDEPGAP